MKKLLYGLFIAVLLCGQCNAGVTYSGVLIGGDMAPTQQGWFGSKSTADNATLLANKIELWKFTQSDSGATGLKIGAIFQGAQNASAHFKLCVYSEDGATLLLETGDLNGLVTTAGELSFDAVATSSLPAGNYWIGLWTDDYAIYIKSAGNTAGNTKLVIDLAYSGTFPSSIDTSGASSNNYPRSLFCEYEY